MLVVNNVGNQTNCNTTKKSTNRCKVLTTNKFLNFIDYNKMPKKGKGVGTELLFYAAYSKWNKLPLNIKSAQSLSHLKYLYKYQYKID